MMYCVDETPSDNYITTENETQTNKLNLYQSRSYCHFSFASLVSISVRLEFLNAISTIVLTRVRLARFIIAAN